MTHRDIKSIRAALEAAQVSAAYAADYAIQESMPVLAPQGPPLIKMMMAFQNFKVAMIQDDLLEIIRELEAILHWQEVRLERRARRNGRTCS
jgi:hypothetical protein